MLDSRKAIVTGGSRGFGLEIAREFIREGSNVCICSRNEAELKGAIESLKEYIVDDKQRIVYIKCDISDCSDIDRLYEFAYEELSGLDIVVNNAGIQGPIGEFDKKDWNEIIRVLNTNLIGTLYSIRKAVEVFKRQRSSSEQKEDKSIVNVSGGGATGCRPFFVGYAISKTGIVRATEIIAKEVEKHGIRVNAIAPGAMNTKMLEEIITAGNNAGDELDKAREQAINGGSSIENAAKCVAWLSSEKAVGITGRLISAIWDDWENLNEHFDDIRDSDIFTLRRIIPKDKGFEW